MTLLALTTAAVLEVGGDYLIRRGMPADLVGGALIVAGGAVIQLWR